MDLDRDWILSYSVMKSEFDRHFAPALQAQRRVEQAGNPAVAPQNQFAFQNNGPKFGFNQSGFNDIGIGSRKSVAPSSRVQQPNNNLLKFSSNDHKMSANEVISEVFQRVPDLGHKLFSQVNALLRGNPEQAVLNAEQRNGLNLLA